MAGDRTRPTWRVTMSPGGWGPPWPQAIELVEMFPGDQWTLIGGLMVQLHAAHAGLPMTRRKSSISGAVFASLAERE